MKQALLFALLIVNVFQAMAQPGTLDPSFGTSGHVTLGSSFTATTFQSDGKLVGVRSVAGNIVVNRFNTDGTPDASFGSGGSVTTDLGSASDQPVSLSISNDGKIVVLANTVYLLTPGSTPEPAFGLVRYNINGTPDASFGVSGIVIEAFFNVHRSDQLDKVAIGIDGKVIVSEHYGAPGGNYILIRVFNPNGSRNTTFSIIGPGDYGSNSSALFIQNNGKLVIGGATYHLALTIHFDLLLARRNSDLTPDLSFNDDGILVSSSSDPVNTLTVQDDEKIVVATDNQILRFNINGTLDPSFGTGGVVTAGFAVKKIVVQSDRKIITGGSSGGNFALARYNSNGTLDASFGTGGMTTSDFGSNESIMNMNISGDRLYAYGTTSPSGNSFLAAYLLTTPVVGAIESNSSSGTGALASNTTGTFNTATGFQALHFNTSGSNNTATGVGSLYSNTTGNSNTAYGVHALRLNTTGSQNTGIGVDALLFNTTGSQNTATGTNALRSNTIGIFNTATGNNSLFENTTGLNNTAYGYNALRANTTGINNVAVGYNTSSTLNSSNSTFLGAEATASGNFTNATALGYGAVATASGQVRIGNTSVTSIGGQVEWTTFSDGRFKKNIHEDVPGLEFITKLRPVTYKLDINGIDSKLKASIPKGSIRGNEEFQSAEKQAASAKEAKAKEEKAKIKYTGFVAQEVESVARKLGYDFSGVDVPKNNEDFYGLRYSEFVVPLVKSVQELDAQNKKLKEELNELKAMVTKLMNDRGLTPNGSNIPVNLSAGYLGVNKPNPFNSATIILYHVPQSAGAAQVVITSQKGQTLKTIMINKGDGQITLNAGTLSEGTYVYTLWIDGKQADSKQMMIMK